MNSIAIDMPVVGACKISACQHNDDYECTAEQITVGQRGHGACCLTYQQRMLPDSPAHPEHAQT